MSSYSRQQLEQYLGTIDVKSKRLMDVGGAQNPIKNRVKSWDVEEYVVADLIKPHETKKAPDMRFDLNDRLTSHVRANRLFDTIFCIEVMEYIYNPVQAMRNLSAWLEKDGVLYISFPFIYPHHEPKGKDFLRYTQWGALKLIDEAGLELVELNVRKTQAVNMIGVYRSEGMRPAKEFAGHNAVAYVIKARKK